MLNIQNFNKCSENLKIVKGTYSTQNFSTIFKIVPFLTIKNNNSTFSNIITNLRNYLKLNY